jgi:hypothetical protein
MRENYTAKANAAIYALRYNYSKDIGDLKKAAEHLEENLVYLCKLTELTRDTYIFTQSIQTSQRKISYPGFEDGKPANHHWIQVLEKYEKSWVILMTILRKPAKNNKIHPP